MVGHRDLSQAEHRLQMDGPQASVIGTKESNDLDAKSSSRVGGLKSLVTAGLKQVWDRRGVETALLAASSWVTLRFFPGFTPPVSQRRDKERETDTEMQGGDSVREGGDGGRKEKQERG